MSIPETYNPPISSVDRLHLVSFRFTSRAPCHLETRHPFGAMLRHAADGHCLYKLTRTLT